MTDDLVKRLREASGKYDEYCWHLEAADRIETLEVALQDIINERGVCGHCGNVATGRNGGMVICDKTIFGFRGLCKWTQQQPKDIARRALREKMIDEVTE